MINKKMIFLISAFVLITFMSFNVHADDPNVCCEKTITGFYCQNAPQSQCDTSNGLRVANTACDSTSYCKTGTCFNSLQGTCLSNTPQNVCNNNGGTWSLLSPQSCNLGCCILGDQASFVSLTRCKYLSGQLGLSTNFNKGITDETQCILQVQNQDQGACVYSSDYQTTCKFTTRAECSTGINGTTSKGTFFKDKLCTAPELETNCAWSKQTSCRPGKDGVYFLDTCGNFANVYDSSKIPSGTNLNESGEAVQDYWTNVKTVDESCNPGSSNANSKSCGNCDYLSGSYCRASSVVNVNANYGDYVCADLNCASTSAGPKKHGESWCDYSNTGKPGTGINAVGSKFFKHICENGEEIVEPCADYRQEECIQSSINTSSGSFSQAACRVNRWQDCNSQTNKDDCTNTDVRDCTWLSGIELTSTSSNGGACVPKNAPGLNFWNSTTATSTCSQGSYTCTVTMEKGLLGGETCKSGCECLDSTWKQQRIDVCESLGDCGPKVNWIGDAGYTAGYNLTTK